MKIAIDCRMIGASGIGTYISELLPFFIRNNDCLLIGRTADISQYTAESLGISPEQFHVKCCPCDIPVFSVKELIAFPRSISDKINACDIYYTPYCNIPSGITVPIFSTIHDIVFLDVPGLASSIGTEVRRWYYRHAIRKSRVVFTVSEFSSSRIRTVLHSKKPVIVTHSAVPSWLLPAPGDHVEKTDTILFVGNIKKHKGLHVLLPAFLDARKNGLTAQLVIVGSAEKFRTGDDSIRREIDAMPKGSVRFTGKVSDAELKQLYAQARLLVQPSLYEGFGLPPLEALTLGTNALISDIPVFKEIYKDFPVTFFASGSIDDLSKKLLAAVALPAPRDFPHCYSFDHTYRMISAAIDFYRK